MVAEKIILETNTNVLSSHRQSLKNFPVSLFTSVMGVCGLSVAYQRYADIWNPPIVSFALLSLACLLFACIGLAYAYKLIFFRSDAMAEFKHPVKANFFAAISISLLVLGTATFSFQRTLAFLLWGAGTVLQLIFMLVLASRWITRDYEITQLNPLWFLPAAGNLLVPITGVDFGQRDISWFFFSVGLFYWLVLFIVLFYRLTFHPRLADQFLPTLFILIAPPALGFIAYLQLAGTFDLPARLLLNVAMFTTLLLLFLLPYFFKVRFTVSWWAFTFPLCIATSAVAVAYQATGLAAFAWVSTLLLVLSTTAVAFVFARTLVALKQNSLFDAGAG